MRVAALDTLLAIKALALSDDLTSATRRVGVALIESFNRRTGQCDPSIETLARLLNISTRTVIRSIDLLVEKGYFFKARHGGHFHRNAYAPNWAKFSAVIAAWNDRRKRLKAVSAFMSGLPCQPSHVEGDADVNQTYLSNLPKKPDGAEELKTSNSVRSLVRASTRTSDEDKSTRAHANANARFHVKTKSSAEVVRDEAERRWTQALTQRMRTLPTAFAAMLDAIDDELREATTALEMRNRGAGVRYVLDILEQRALRGKHDAQ